MADTLSRVPVMGVKSGDNSAFFLDVKRVRRNAVETSDGLHVPLSAVCRCVRGRDVRRWSIGEPAWMLDFRLSISECGNFRNQGDLWTPLSVYDDTVSSIITMNKSGK